MSEQSRPGRLLLAHWPQPKLAARGTLEHDIHEPVAVQLATACRGG